MSSINNSPFQFQTGAIKSAGRFLSSVRRAVPFQFQTGAIKSLPWLSQQFSLWLRFNSKLVRLKVRTCCSPGRCLPRFNSKLVRLKEPSRLRKSCSAQNGFNSKLVRLKGDNIEFVKPWCKGFNSKLVRLKVSGEHPHPAKEPVSIPNWCD